MPETPDPTSDRSTDQLSRLDLGPVAPSMDAAAVRGAGDRRRRRTTAAIAVAAVVAVIAVGTPVALALNGGPDGTVEPAGPGPSHSPSTSTYQPGQIPDDLDLEAGLTQPGGPPVDGPNDGVGRAIDLDMCGESRWPPPTGDLGSPLDAEWSSVADESYFRARTLTTYADGAEASAIFLFLHAALRDCPSESTASGTIEYARIDLGDRTEVGERSITFSALYQDGGLTGNAIYQFFQVGSAMVATVDVAEWSPQSVDQGARQLTADNAELLDGLCAEFTFDDCSGG